LAPGRATGESQYPDAHLLDATIRAMILERPLVEPAWKQHLLLEKGEDNETGFGVCVDHHDVPHIALIGDERPKRRRRRSGRR
jgi:hypothetical protein